MANNVTMTRTENSVVVRYYGNDTKELHTATAYFSGTLDNASKANIRKQFEKMNAIVVKFYDDTIKAGDTTKYSLDCETFYLNAERVEKRPNGDYISRTAKATKVDVTLYNNYVDDIEHKTLIIDGTNESIIKRNIKKRFKDTDLVVLDYDVIDIITALYIMSVDKFIELATVVE